MLLFVLLVFFYYAVYDVVLPLDNQALLVVAAALLAVAGLAGRASALAGGAGRSPKVIATGLALLLVPAVPWLAAPDPVGPVSAGLPLRVMSYNLHFGFDVDGWSRLDGTASAIEASGADVVGLQEVSRGWYVNGSTDMLGWLQRRLRMPHALFAGASDDIWGNAILSRRPILASGVVRLPREGVPLRRNAIWADVDLGAGRRLRVVSTHLHYVQGPDGDRVRLAQLPVVLAAARGRAATVLLGDLNATPGSAEIAEVRRAGLVDAFVAGRGRPADELTFPSDRPERRIDWIWVSPDLRVAEFRATTTTASDHRGIAVTVTGYATV